MTWNVANHWINNQFNNGEGFFGYNGWRFPVLTPYGTNGQSSLWI